MDNTIAELIFRESGGFTGLQRGCTVVPGALPEAPRGELQSLLRKPARTRSSAAPSPAELPGTAPMPDMQVYTLELVMQPDTGAESGSAAPVTSSQHRVLRYPASDVPENLSALIGYLRDHARPLEPR